jgi:small subunit ribosomal protein S17e
MSLETKTLIFSKYSLFSGDSMGKIRTRMIKRIAFRLLELYPDQFTTDFEKNKKILEEKFSSIMYSKKIRNKIAGYITSRVSIKEQSKEF